MSEIMEFEWDKDVLKAALKKWGAGLQELIAIEEMAELTKALIKQQRSGYVKECESDVIEEIADVQIMLWQLALIYGRQDVQEMITYKMERLVSRLEQQDEENK